MPCGGAGCGDDRGKWACYAGDVDRACTVPRCMYLSYTPFCLLNISSEVKYIGCCRCLLCVTMSGTVSGAVPGLHA